MLTGIFILSIALILSILFADRLTSNIKKLSRAAESIGLGNLDPELTINSNDEIKNVAKLARISLSDKELDTMSVEASSILDFVETIQNTNTDGISATSQVTGLADVWREDEIKKSKVPPKDLLAGAPDVQDGYVKVKKVL